jgi:O-acetyl-ADP-ribose deacetylase (regulator of RNase III)
MPRIELTHGDITDEQVDALVNAANSSLMGGGGVDGAIHRKGGAAILRECREIRRMAHPDGLPTGKAVATTAGNLRARWVIHTVGPLELAAPVAIRAVMGSDTKVEEVRFVLYGEDAFRAFEHALAGAT